MTTNVLIATTRGLFRLGEPGPVAFAQKHVRAIVPDPRVGGSNGARLFAVVGRHEIWRLGDEWERVTRMEEQVWSLCACGGRLWIGTERAHLASSSLEAARAETNLEPSRDEAFEEHPDRAEWYTPWGGPPAVRSMSCNGGSLLVNVHVGGIHRREAAGWTQTIDVHADVHQVVAHDGRLFAATGRGFAESLDGGESWRFTTDGIHFPYMRAVAVAGDTLLASASNGAHGDRGAVYRRAVASDEPFQRCRLPWFEGNVDTFCIATRNSVVAVGGPRGGVHLSDDGGDTWTVAAAGLPEINAVLIGDVVP